MGKTSGIEWCTSTWNPWLGCHKVSAGCKHCYMFREQLQYGNDPNVVRRSKTTFNAPLKWNEPKLIFTCSWSDWFIEEADEWRDEAWEIIRRTPQHTYQILTKRPERIFEVSPREWIHNGFPQNVWIGISAEDQENYLQRMPYIIQVDVNIRFLSCEPLIGPLSLGLDLLLFDWVIVGGESGAGAREMKEEWAVDIVKQCQVAGTACFVKQLGTGWSIVNHSKDRKGGIMDEWPEDLRIREMPDAPAS